MLTCNRTNREWPCATLGQARQMAASLNLGAMGTGWTFTDPFIAAMSARPHRMGTRQTISLAKAINPFHPPPIPPVETRPRADKEGGGP